MNIKKYSNIVLIMFLLISILGLNFTINKINDSKKLGGLKIDTIPESLSSLTEDSDSIVLGIPEEEPTIIEYGDATFYLTKVNVEENYSNNELESFTLLQTYSEEDPIVSPNEPLILFLSKYSGPIIDDSNVYVCTSLGYSQYSIEDNTIIPALKDDISTKIVKKTDSLNTFKKNIKNVRDYRN